MVMRYVVDGELGNLCRTDVISSEIRNTPLLLARPRLTGLSKPLVLPYQHAYSLLPLAL